MIASLTWPCTLPPGWSVEWDGPSAGADHPPTEWHVSYGLYRCVTCFARRLLLVPLRQWHLNNLCSLELRSTSLLWTWFCNKFTFRCKLWDVWDDLCCNLWAHLRVGVVCAILEEHGFNRGFTRGTTGACRFGSELLSNEDQCTRAQYFGWFRHIQPLVSSLRMEVKHHLYSCLQPVLPEITIENWPHEAINKTP